jgi:hypothetical protein
MSIRQVTALVMAALVAGFVLGSFGIAGAIDGDQDAPAALAAQCAGDCGSCSTADSAACPTPGNCASCPTPGECATCPNAGNCGSGACDPAAMKLPAGECGTGACGACP